MHKFFLVEQRNYTSFYAIVLDNENIYHSVQQPGLWCGKLDPFEYITEVFLFI